MALLEGTTSLNILLDYVFSFSVIWYLGIPAEMIFLYALQFFQNSRIETCSYHRIELNN